MQHQRLQEVQLFSYNNFILPSPPKRNFMTLWQRKDTVETVMFKEKLKNHTTLHQP